MLTSALRSGGLSTTSVAEATPSRSPGVSSTAFRAQSPNLRFASLMDMDFAVSCPLVRRWRLVSGFCSSSASVSAVPKTKNGAHYFYLNGFNNPGFSGGPVAFYDYKSNQWAIVAVISGFEPEAAKKLV